MQQVFRQHAPGAPDGPGQIKSTEKLASTDPKVQAYMAAHPDWDADQTPYYRYHLVDGTIVDAVTGHDGRYQIIDYKPSQKFTQQQAQAARVQTPGQQAQDQNEAILQAQREKNAALPKEQDPAYETDEDRRKRAEARIVQQGAAARQQQQDTRQAGADQRADQANQRAEDAAGRAEQRAATSEQRAARNPVQKNPVTGKLEEILYNPDGTVKGVRELPNQNDQLPSNAPQFIPDLSRPGLGLTEFSSQVRARTDLTPVQQNAIITEAHTTATAEANRINAIIGVQEGQRNSDVTQRGQDTVQANTRLTTASNDFSTSVRGAGELGKYSRPSVILQDLLRLSYEQGKRYGGFETPARVQPGPAVQQVNEMGLNSPLGAPPQWQADAAQAQAEAAQRHAQAAAGTNTLAPPVFSPAPPTNVLPGQAPVNPAYGEPGSNPNAPVGMSPLGAGPWGAPPDPSAPPSGLAPTIAMAGNQALSGYDPAPLNRELLAAGVPPDVIDMLGGVGQAAA
jgi:hypothetical protein